MLWITVSTTYNTHAHTLFRSTIQFIRRKSNKYFNSTYKVFNSQETASESFCTINTRTSDYSQRQTINFNWKYEKEKKKSFEQRFSCCVVLSAIINHVSRTQEYRVNNSLFILISILVPTNILKYIHNRNGFVSSKSQSPLNIEHRQLHIINDEWKAKIGIPSRFSLVFGCSMPSMQLWMGGIVCCCCCISRRCFDDACNVRRTHRNWKISCIHFVHRNQRCRISYFFHFFVVVIERWVDNIDSGNLSISYVLLNQIQQWANKSIFNLQIYEKRHKHLFSHQFRTNTFHSFPLSIVLPVA